MVFFFQLKCITYVYIIDYVCIDVMHEHITLSGGGYV